MWARLRAVGRMPPITPITHETCSGGCSAPMSSSGSRLARWPESKHSCSGRIPHSFMQSSSARIVSKLFSNTIENTNSLRRREYFAKFIEPMFSAPTSGRSSRR